MDTPSYNVNENLDRVGERVKDYLNNANLSRFSVYDYPVVASIYKAIGYNPSGANKQIQNESFGKLLISTKFFEQEKTFIILKPLYHKTTENEANKYFRSPHCRSYVERTSGCNCLVCRCKTAFCNKCSATRTRGRSRVDRRCTALAQSREA